MALVGQVATIAQLVGVDAYGLITMIAEAALTVRRNRATCRQLARRVQMIGDLLRQLHAAQAPLTPRPETRRPVEELEETLRRAYLLVRSCQRRSYMYRCFLGTRHADELREVQGEIGFYLQLFPLVSYVDATLTWARLLSKADEPSCQEGPMNNKVPGPQAQLSGPLNRSLTLPQHKHDEQASNIGHVWHGSGVRLRFRADQSQPNTLASEQASFMESVDLQFIF